MIAEIDGLNIRSESEFHKEIGQSLGFGPHYGNNLDALWDVLGRDIERPITLVWKNSDASRKRMLDEFEKIVDLLRELEKEDAKYDVREKFALVLR